MNGISRRILCVDDEENVVAGLKRQLRRQFDVTTATSGEEGLAVIEEKGPFAVIITDYNMPGITGIEFLQKAHLISPHTVSVMLTGQRDLDVAVAALHEGCIFRFLQKPCPRDLLVKTIEDSLEQYRLVVSERMLAAELDRANHELLGLNENLEARVAERTATIRRLHRFVSELNGLDSLDDLAEVVVATTAEMLRSRRVSLMLPDASREYLTIKAATGIDPRVRQRIRVPIGAPVAGRVFAESQSLVVNEPGQFASPGGRYDADLFASVPLASTSLVTPEGPVGVLNVTERMDKAGYDEEAVASLKAIAEAGAIAIRNQIRAQERNEARDATILALAKLAEHRDPETGLHLERVQGYCRMLGESLAEAPKYASVVDKAFIETIVRSSPLHDIGKVGIPDHILLKPGKLTPEEFKVMKKHSAIGGDTIRTLVKQGRTQSFLQMGMEIAYSHHEKYNGSGYPDGLAGEDIPLSARIMAVADVYDALTTQRVYKPAMPHEKAAAIIRQDSGSHFDPDVVEVFLAREEEFKELAARCADQDSSRPPDEKAVEPQASAREALVS